MLLTTTAPTQNFLGSNVALYSNHTSLGYCTLRNGMPPQSSLQTSLASVSMSPVPNTFTTQSHTTCTLPRHPQSVVNPNHHWPSYGGTIGEFVFAITIFKR